MIYLPANSKHFSYKIGIYDLLSPRQQHPELLSYTYSRVLRNSLSPHEGRAKAHKKVNRMEITGFLQTRHCRRSWFIIAVVTADIDLGRLRILLMTLLAWVDAYNDT